MREILRASLFLANLMESKEYMPVVALAVGVIGGAFAMTLTGGLSAGTLMSTVSDHARRIEALETKTDKGNTEWATAFAIIKSELSSMKAGQDAIKLVLERVQNSQERTQDAQVRIDRMPLGIKK
jgi:hypothetical protein